MDLQGFLRLHSHFDLALKNTDLMPNHQLHLPVSDRRQKEQFLIFPYWPPIRLGQLQIIPCCAIKQPKLHHDRPHRLNPLLY